ncbi:hypothetical protein RIB2604_04100120 [Aspergillus luchuensis]|uniref:Uncharacterized protein n=1 Tax=Aspergillus kawachii TaxID=1069201 RepID=A0A146G2Z6_ASPKA|nr:hypothetical protein RIB2604_04100120 [Aspergillus luchuensis]
MDSHSLRIDEISGECSTAAPEEITPHWVSELARLVDEGNGLVDVKKGTREGSGLVDYMLHEFVLMVHDMVARKTRNEEVRRRLKDILPEV